jgi:hypothetical protein
MIIWNVSQSLSCFPWPSLLSLGGAGGGEGGANNNPNNPSQRQSLFNLLCVFTQQFVLRSFLFLPFSVLCFAELDSSFLALGLLRKKVLLARH